jgi:hypothetical protein
MQFYPSFTIFRCSVALEAGERYNKIFAALAAGCTVFGFHSNIILLFT